MIRLLIFYIYFSVSVSAFLDMLLPFSKLVAKISAVLDIALSWKSRHSMSFHAKLRFILKAIAATVWVVLMPVSYAYSWRSPSGIAETIKNWLGGHSGSSPSLFIMVILIYLSPNMLSTLLFVFPFIRRYLERSDIKIVMLMMWWSQVLYSYIFKSLVHECFLRRSLILILFLGVAAEAIHSKGYA